MTADNRKRELVVRVDEVPFTVVRCDRRGCTFRTDEPTDEKLKEHSYNAPVQTPALTPNLTGWLIIYTAGGRNEVGPYRTLHVCPGCRDGALLELIGATE